MRKELLWKKPFGETCNTIDDGNTQNHFFQTIRQ
jgi:hypothetical protein